MSKREFLLSRNYFSTEDGRRGRYLCVYVCVCVFVYVLVEWGGCTCKQ